ncbi:MAG: hypothetical protein K8F92_20445 [Hyphomicrobium sp.]|uniref:hypothetical protein n=1 Tax=Hyphomicrobium sp. TaxID=82 RepID=UPI001322BD96|nr:hypothetical protein [Hyphomicrobium sp.]KAB2941356.1 MAG: hypothetical protein F9K20_09635 [Hyphomicrobium sp.]MBZ0212004.1 hypothetical protein [Hyphomicrobium sp.]
MRRRTPPNIDPSFVFVAHLARATSVVHANWTGYAKRGLLPPLADHPAFGGLGFSKQKMREFARLTPAAIVKLEKCVLISGKRNGHPDPVGAFRRVCGLSDPQTEVSDPLREEIALEPMDPVVSAVLEVAKGLQAVAEALTRRD